MRKHIDFVGSAKWLIDSADEIAATRPTISIEHATGRMVAVELLRVLDVNAALLAALHALLAVQNGPPLVEYTAEWDAAVRKAKAAITAADDGTAD